MLATKIIQKALENRPQYKACTPVDNEIIEISWPLGAVLSKIS